MVRIVARDGGVGSGSGRGIGARPMKHGKPAGLLAILFHDSEMCAKNVSIS
jgi:hypothetical protein